jgi:arginyl-tRNA synthetase
MNISRGYIFGEVERRVQTATTTLITVGYLPPGIDQSRIAVEPPRDPAHGDMATNAAMVVAKNAGKKPRDLAEAYAQELRNDGDLIEKVEVVGPGFINLTLKPAAWIYVLRGAVQSGLDYGASSVGNDAPVNVEYVSANPTGPMHVGHCRGAVFGDALASLLDFSGFKVTREYYINDAGAQVDVLARSAFLRYREALGENIGDIPEGLYPGAYLKPVGKLIAKNFGEQFLNQPEHIWLPVVRDIAINEMMIAIRNDLAALNISQDVFYSERSLI